MTADAVTDSTGRYELAVPAGEGVLTIQNRYRNGTFDTFALLQDSVLVGEVRTDYRFTRSHVKGSVRDKDGSPLQRGTLTYYLRSTSLSLSTPYGAPAAAIRHGKFELDLTPPGEYVFWLHPLGEFLVTAIAIHGDTTVTIDMRALSEETGRDK